MRWSSGTHFGGTGMFALHSRVSACQAAVSKQQGELCGICRRPYTHICLQASTAESHKC
jgi:hypothetical protein